MATIQVRNVPEDVHRTFQSRAQAAGKSLQEYLLAELTEAAHRRSPAELVAEVEQQIQLHGDNGLARHTSARFIREDRESH